MPTQWRHLRWLWAYPGRNQRLEKDEAAGETGRSESGVCPSQKAPKEILLTGSVVPHF